MVFPLKNDLPQLNRWAGLLFSDCVTGNPCWFLVLWNPKRIVGSRFLRIRHSDEFLFLGARPWKTQNPGFERAPRSCEPENPDLRGFRRKRTLRNGNPDISNHDLSLWLNAVSENSLIYHVNQSYLLLLTILLLHKLDCSFCSSWGATANGNWWLRWISRNRIRIMEN
jgi:hypothetical protein